MATYRHSDDPNLEEHDLDWVRMIRPSLRKGIDVKDIDEIPDDETQKVNGFKEKFLGGLKSLKKELQMEDIEDKTFLEMVSERTCGNWLPTDIMATSTTKLTHSIL